MCHPRSHARNLPRWWKERRKSGQRWQPPVSEREHEPAAYAAGFESPVRLGSFFCWHLSSDPEGHLAGRNLVSERCKLVSRMHVVRDKHEGDRDVALAVSLERPDRGYLAAIADSGQYGSTHHSSV